MTKTNTSFDVSLLVHKMGGWEGGAYFKFRPMGGAFIQRGRLFEGGTNSKIYSILGSEEAMLHSPDVQTNNNSSTSSNLMRIGWSRQLTYRHSSQ